MGNCVYVLYTPRDSKANLDSIYNAHANGHVRNNTAIIISIIIIKIIVVIIITIITKRARR